MGKIASTLLARGDGWTVHDVVCSAGPADGTFEEQHSRVSVAIVVSGSFQYRTITGRALMTPGSILLGNAGHCFECGHEHAAGDRCIAFNFAPELFEEIAGEAGAWRAARSFAAPLLPPVRASAGLVAVVNAALNGIIGPFWDEMALRVAAFVARNGSDRSGNAAAITPNAVARVTAVVRVIERSTPSELSLQRLAAVAGLSRYHFLRTFQQVTGLTPHQYIKRARLRSAAVRIADKRSKVIDAAYGSGFGDVSNFNHAFKAEFGEAPLAFRASLSARPAALGGAWRRRYPVDRGGGLTPAAAP